MKPLLGASLSAAVAVAAAGAIGQETLDRPVEEYQPRELDSGVLANLADERDVVFAAVVESPDAPWLRLYFRDATTLVADSTVRFTSLLDGEVQELDRFGMAMWGKASAYFNGDAVLVEVIAAPNSVGNRIVLDGVGVQMPHGPSPRTPCGICDSDEREPSNEDWAGRIVPPGCSGAVYAPSSCAVSAGHCRKQNMVMQFRVPPSLSNCDIQHPPVSEQFPVTQYIYQSTGAGADWMVMTVGTNDKGQTPYDRYGEYRPIADSPAPEGGAVSAWGFGTSKQCERSQTQQKSSGMIKGGGGGRTFIHTATTAGGNSGSGMLYDGEIVGIATHRICPPGCPNVAQRMDVPVFAGARQDLCGSVIIEALDPPDELQMDRPTSFGVMINSGADDIVPGSEQLFYRYDGGAFNSVPLVFVSGNTYEAELPDPGFCPGDAEFYVRAEGVDTGVVTDPPGGASDPFTASIACPPEPLTVEAIDPPTVLVEGEPTGFDVTVDPGDDVMIPGSAQLFYRFGSGDSFTATGMSLVGGTTWRATIPGAPCVEEAEFYVFTIGAATGIVTDPPLGADDPFVADVDCVGCPPDWNGDGVVDSDDLFDFLADWADGDADYNGDGVTDSDDLFDFLADWSDPGQFPGC